MFRIAALLGMCLLLVLQACVGRSGSLERTPTEISVGDLLTAHRVAEDPALVSVFTAEAVRRVSFNPALGAKDATTFERLITVARNGRFFRYERTAESGPTRQIDVFDGNAVHHLMSANGRLIDNSTSPGESPSDQVLLELKTFGLLPILSRLMDSKAPAVFEGRTPQGFDRVRVEVAGRTWVLFVDAKRLIRRLEFPDNAVDYDDYREIQTVRLPFKQRFFSKGKLYYELTFNRVELKPTFPADYFTRESALNELTR